jgi:hypothetical protein
MADDYPGRGSAIGLGIETTWGTFVAPSGSAWLRPISCDIARVRSKQPRAVLTMGSAGVAMNRAMYVESDIVGGSFTVEAEYHSLPLLLEWAMAASATAGVGPYSHVQKIGAEPALSLSIDQVRGYGGTSDKFEGCYATQWSLSVSAASAPMTFSATVLGQTGTERGTASSPTFSTVDAPVLYHQAGTFTFNSVAYTFIDMTVSVDNAIAPRVQLGSLNTLQPKRSGYMSVTTTVTLEVKDALRTAYLQDTASDYTITFTGASPYEMTIEGHNCIITACSDPVASAGILRQTVTFMSLSDGTDDGLEITIINSEADNRTVEAS